MVSLKYCMANKRKFFVATILIQFIVVAQWIVPRFSVANRAASSAAAAGQGGSGTPKPSGTLRELQEVAEQSSERVEYVNSTPSDDGDDGDGGVANSQVLTLSKKSSVVSGNGPAQMTKSHVEVRQHSSPGFQEAIFEGPDKFQQVGQLDAWLFSAFYDVDRIGYGGPDIRLFGLAAHQYNKKHIQCIAVTESGEQLKLHGKVTELPDTHSTPIPPVEVFCPLKGGLRPVSVIISFKAGHATEPIKIEYRPRRENKRQFTVCHAPLQNKYNFTSQLVQSIELNRILGADHFFVYNTSISPQTDLLLRHYQALGILTVVQWPVPMPQKTWYFAQMSATNDCLYRNRNQSEYVVFVDTDEFIMPRSLYNWREMVSLILANPSLTHLNPEGKEIKVPGWEAAVPRRRLMASVIQSFGAWGGNPSPQQGKEETKQQDQQLNSNLIPEQQQLKLNQTQEQQQLEKQQTLLLEEIKAERLKLEKQNEELEKALKKCENATAQEAPQSVSVEDQGLKDEVTKRRQVVGALEFRNAFFDNRRMDVWQSMVASPEEWGLTDKDVAFIARFNVQPLQVFRRTDYVFPDKIRTKLIVRPEYIHTCGIHFVWEFVKGARPAWVNPEVAILHHYRFFDYKSSNQVDHTAYKFKDELLSKLWSRFSELSQIFGPL